MAMWNSLSCHLARLNVNKKSPSKRILYALLLRDCVNLIENKALRTIKGYLSLVDLYPIDSSSNEILFQRVS